MSGAGGGKGINPESGKKAHSLSVNVSVTLFSLFFHFCVVRMKYMWLREMWKGMQIKASEPETFRALFFQRRLKNWLKLSISI